jgi:hypothetical protein
VARCLYGFTDAPIKATVSVSAEDGARTVETIVTGERDGWFSLGAYGFGFSSPTIKVQLKQDSTPSATNSSAGSTTTPQIESEKVMVKKITCVKGAKTKTLKAGKTKCPKGFKKA